MSMGRPGSKPSVGPSSTPDLNLPADWRLSIQYHRRAYPGKVYPLIVETSGPAPGGARLLAPFVPGALVTPPELPLDPSGGKHTFFITPLATGRLPEARIEVRTPGQAPRSVPLPLHATTQALARCLLLLAFLLTGLALYATKYHVAHGTRIETFSVVEDGVSQTRSREVPMSPGETATRDIRRAIVENIPDLPDYLGKEAPALTAPLADAVAGGVGTLYGVWCAMDGEKPNFALFLGLLGLAFVAWWLHRPVRCTLVKKPVGPTTRLAETGPAPSRVVPLPQSRPDYVEPI